MILVIDNYDSFTYNLVQYLGTIRPDIQVVRNDQVTLEEIEKWDPSHILLSPGPGYPEEAGICINVVKKFQGKIPILGICLGHQAICQAYGAVIAPAKEKPGNPKIGLFPVCRIGRDYRSSQVSFSGSKKRYPSGLSEDHGSDRRRRGHGGRA